MVRRRQVRVTRRVEVLQISMIARFEIGQIAPGETQSRPQ